MKTMFALTSLALIGVLTAASPARAQQTKDIVDTAVAAGSFTTASNGVVHVVDTVLLPPGK